MLKLNDPRNWSISYPKTNMVISQAQQEISTNSDNSLLSEILEDLLKRKQDQLISVAYNLAPNYQCAEHIRTTLNQILTKPNIGGAQLFVIPLTLICGSSQSIKQTSDVDSQAIRELLISHLVIKDNPNNIISKSLTDYTSLVKLSPSQIYHYNQSFSETKEFITTMVGNSLIIGQGESVHLRYLLGASAYSDLYGSEFNVNNFSSLKKELVSLITKQLELPTLSVCPLNFPPTSLVNATVSGLVFWQEISLIVGLSSILRKLRLAGSNPKCIISSSLNQIRITVIKDRQPCWTFNWQIHRADNFNEISQLIYGLINDLQLEVEYND